MTSTVSFKDKLKQAFSFFKWDLKGCAGTLAVFGILAAVFTTIILTLCLVAGVNLDAIDYAKSVVPDVSSMTSFEASIVAFQFFSVNTLYFMTTIFTIIYTVKIFSYLHNKRKADLYGSLPVGRVTLYLTKAASAYIFSVVPTLFFMGIISLISICFGQPLVSEITQIYTKIIMGALACISAYGLISVCCGTTFNAVVMFITVCIVYPLSAMFVLGTVSSFFTGFYSGIFRNHFIMNALNPLAAYDGINIIYWIIFSLVCTAAAALLIKRRKAERAQSSFAYYLPCHIIKALVAFLVGMFLGTLFGALNVLGDGLLGFIFGFVLGSVPAFVIAHLIFYKGFSKLIKTAIPLGGLIVVVIGAITVFNFDVFGYNSYVPTADDIKSAGYFATNSGYVNSGESLRDIVDNMPDDFDDAESKEEIISLHRKFVKDLDNLDSQKRFMGVWLNIFSENLTIPAGESTYCFAYRTNSGFSSSRVYTSNILESLVYYDSAYSDSIFYTLDDVKITSSAKYVEKYSGFAKADRYDTTELSVIGNTKDKLPVFYSIISSDNYDEATAPESSYNDLEKVREAFKKDLKENPGDAEKVMFSRLSPNSNSYYYYDYSYYLSDTDVTQLERAQAEYPDIVCQIDFCADNSDISDFSSIINMFTSGGITSNCYETYMIPESYANTINALREIGVLNDDLTFNEDSKYYSVYYTTTEAY